MAWPAAYRPRRSVRRSSLWTFRSGTRALGAKAGISPATGAGHPDASHCRIGARADRPVRAASQMPSEDEPAAQIAPAPVMRTLVPSAIRNPSPAARGLRTARGSRASGPSAARMANRSTLLSVNRFGVPEHNAAIRTAETEGVGYGDPDRAHPGPAAHEVEIALRVGLHQVHVHRHDAVMDRERADRSLDRARRGDEVPHQALRRAHGDRGGVRTEDRPNGGALAPVI